MPPSRWCRNRSEMAWDAKGRLWVANSAIYPHIKPGQTESDKILILEDTDHDGKADKSTTFFEGLLIPTGIWPQDGGVYVANSTELLFLSDRDGDGKQIPARYCSAALEPRTRITFYTASKAGLMAIFISTRASIFTAISKRHLECVD